MPGTGTPGIAANARSSGNSDATHACTAADSAALSARPHASTTGSTPVMPNKKKASSDRSWVSGTVLARIWEGPPPRDPARRGGHVTVQGPRAREVAASMYAATVVPDFRNPDMIRLGLSPLTTSYAELWTAMDVTREIVEAL